MEHQCLGFWSFNCLLFSDMYSYNKATTYFILQCQQNYVWYDHPMYNPFLLFFCFMLLLCIVTCVLIAQAAQNSTRRPLTSATNLPYISIKGLLNYWETHNQISPFLSPFEFKQFSFKIRVCKEFIIVRVMKDFTMQ